ncbi:extracellular solute-binding protein [Pseudomonas sp. CFII64]|jgi:peptide/nickel transport system substrate-binding protein|uniref:ABC transporter substrate-binding protein n=1 Tax=Pseudomonas sp. CFII64 TaxID=911242 RepID=UPI000357DE76|nr:ABC transporter substrate-binding protein [Pseudomonas sp. CFII64]EPJ80167.1 extracellular solute-binding protein [Pseudomonas sp. CFII64]
MKPLVRSLLASALILAAGSVSAQTLRIGYADPVSSLDPELNNYAGDRSVALHAFESLVNRHDDKTLPGLAKSWKVLDDKTWEFALRDDVKWQDGTPLTADDFVFSFERSRAVPGSVASYAGAMRTVESVQAKDDHTLIIKTRSPNANLLPDVDSIYVVSRHVGVTAASADYNSGKAMVGTGPYRFVSYVPGDRTIFERNKDYWGEKPLWDSVDYRFIANAASRTAALLAGDVDVIDKVSPTDVARLRQSENVKVYAYSGLRALLIQPSFRAGLNEYIRDNAGKTLEQNPLLDVRVRKALSLAINRPAIVERIMQGTVTEANQWMPANTFGYNPQLKNIAYDPAAAKALLKEAGFPEGFQLTVHVPGDRYPQAPEAMQAVAQFWSRIGVKVQLEVLPWAVYAGKANKNELAISVIAWGNGTGEAAYALTNILTTVDSAKGQGASNWGHYSNPLVDQALVKATAEFDETRRRAILQESAKVVADDVGIIPLFHYQNIWAARKGLKVEPLVSDRTAATMVTELP